MRVLNRHQRGLHSEEAASERQANGRYIKRASFFLKIGKFHSSLTITNKITKSKKVDENIVRRFYITLVIYELWKTNNAIWKVAAEFQLDRGFIQNLVQSAASFTSGVRNFCECIDELWPYKSLLDELTKRLQFNCSSLDLIPLLELDSVRLARAKQLVAAGLRHRGGAGGRQARGPVCARAHTCSRALRVASSNRPM